MRVLCLVDGAVRPPDRWMWNHLPESAQSDEVDFLWASPADSFPKWGKLISYYPQYLALGWRALRASHKRQYDIIIAWESKTGFPLAGLRRLANVRKPPLLILAFSFKGIASYIPQVSRYVMRGVDHVTVLSPEEIGYYSATLGFPRQNITVCEFGWHDLCRGIQPINGNDFVFTYGRSNRDYGTLFDAVDGLPVRVIVNTRRFVLEGLTIPSNVAVNELMPEHAYAQLLVSTKFVVLPLLDTPYAVGESTIVQTMAAGKAIIATRTHSTPHYVEDGVTGILVPPHDAAAMRKACSYLLERPALCTEMGLEARRRYEAKFTSEHAARRQYSVMQRLVNQCG